MSAVPWACRVRRCHCELTVLPTGRTGTVNGVMAKQTLKYCRRSSTSSATYPAMAVAVCNGSAYTAHETRRFVKALNLEPCTTAVSSPQSNDMAERFVKTMKENYIAFMPKPNVRTALRNLGAAFTHYNENHPHSAQGYHSPREYRRQRALLT